jgi:hypothetical protein
MLIFPIVTALALVSCEQRFTDDNLKVVNHEVEMSDEQIRKGLKDTGVSPKEVESILGQPKRIETHKLPLETQKKEVELVQYFYEQDGETIELHFFDGKLISKVKTLRERADEKSRAAKEAQKSPEEAAAERADKAEHDQQAQKGNMKLQKEPNP